MNKILISALFLVSSALHASCGELEIKVVNNSAHNCTFKNKLMYYGVLPTSSIPATISVNETTPSFFVNQDNVGAGVVLTYACDNEVVKFYSYQEYCGFLSGAGTVGGQPMDPSSLNLEYQTKMGSYLLGRPGQITWFIS
ncbi:MAG: hypothetical protein P4L65_04445 [Legionella sp.]|nr:hypothetical protein [Legionella sp.]